MKEEVELTVLISQKSSGQKRARTCSALCYNAKHPQCVCICGGANHSAGLQKAIENTEEMAETLIEQHCQVKIPMKEAIS